MMKHYCSGELKNNRLNHPDTCKGQSSCLELLVKNYSTLKVQSIKWPVFPASNSIFADASPDCLEHLFLLMIFFKTINCLFPIVRNHQSFNSLQSNETRRKKNIFVGPCCSRAAFQKRKTQIFTSGCCSLNT